MFEKQLTKTQKGLMFERMSMLISNGMSPQEVFIGLGDEFSIVKPKFDFCVNKVKNGESIVNSMNMVNLLSPSEFETLRAGETAGRLPQTLDSLAEFTETVQAQITVAKKAILPNVGYIIAAISVLYGMMLTVIPSIGQNIPASKKANFSVFKFSEIVINFHNNYAMYVGGALVLIIIMLIKKFSTYEGKDQILNFLLTVPVVKEGLLTFNLAMWSRQTSMMIQSGVSFSDVVKMTASSLPKQIRIGITTILKDVTTSGWQHALNKKHWPIDDPRRKWPPEVFGALSSGGDTGNLDKTLYRLSKGLEKSAARLINKSTSLISSITFALAASAIAYVMISVLTATLSGISK